MSRHCLRVPGAFLDIRSRNFPRDSSCARYHPLFSWFYPRTMFLRAKIPSERRISCSRDELIIELFKSNACFVYNRCHCLRRPKYVRNKIIVRFLIFIWDFEIAHAWCLLKRVSFDIVSFQNMKPPNQSEIPPHYYMLRTIAQANAYALNIFMLCLFTFSQYYIAYLGVQRCISRGEMYIL